MRIAFVQKIRLIIFIFWNKESENNLMICHNKLVYTGSAVMENENIVTCPFHAAQFDTINGKKLREPSSS